MTRYFAQSGGLVREPEKAKMYFTDIFSDFEVDQEMQMLWCFYASRDFGEVDLFSKWFNLLGEFIPETQNVQHATSTTHNFINEVACADVVYLHGGYTKEFLSRVENFDLVKMFADKIVCTNSASTIALSVASFDSDSREVVEGLGILPAKFLVHYAAAGYGSDDPRGPIDWKQAKTATEQYGDTALPVFPLKEGEYQIFEI